MRPAIYFIRLGIAILAGAAITATMLDALSRGPINPFNFFGYFTVQSNVIFVLVFAASGILGLLGRQGPAIQMVRAAATTYIVIVGLIYATLLAPLGEAGGVPVAWANTVLHIVTPIYAILDWILVGDRALMPLNRVALILIYPVVWAGVVLYRGATDGWVPYPFLDPAQGTWGLSITVTGIAVVFAVIGLIVLFITYYRGVLRVSEDTNVPR
ncbi:MAG: Pr6Pr family membrane protein [Microbacteriaceae bacterium]